jgi:molybdopterin synthase catalytic subunit
MPQDYRRPPMARYGEAMPRATHIKTNLTVGPVQYGEPLIGGGVVQFIGRTRPERHEVHGALVQLNYQAHRELAESELHRIAGEAATQWDLTSIRIDHATGPVAPGQASVAIEVAADHRDQAFAACRWLIDTLKERVPIWKQEIWADETTWHKGTPVTSP